MEKKKKISAVLFITFLVILYYVLFFLIAVKILPGFWKVLFGLVPLAFAGMMIYVCGQRINEINGGEEDDLGQY
jgi:hypothetical protein